MNYLALKSILCNSKRSLHVIVAVALSISIIYSSFVVADGFVSRVEGMTEGYTLSDIIFVVDEENSLVESKIPQSLLMDIPGDARAVGVVLCEVKSNSRRIEIWGVDFSSFNEVRRPRIRGDLPNEAYMVFTGSSLAEAYGISVGSIIEISLGDQVYDIEVSGIISTGGQYDYGLVASLETARILRPEMEEFYSLIEIRADESFSSLIFNDFSDSGFQFKQGLGMQDYLLGLAAEIKTDLYLVSLVLAFLSLVSVSHTMYKILGDSRSDLLILRSLGLTKWGVTQIVILDSVILSITGAFFGLFLGNILSNTASIFSFLVLKTVFLPVRYDPMLFGLCLLISIVVGVLGGLFSVSLKQQVKEAYGGLKTI